MGKYKKFTDEQIRKAHGDNDCNEASGKSLGITGWSFKLMRERLGLEQKTVSRGRYSKKEPATKRTKKLLTLSVAGEKLFKAAYATCKSVDDAANAIHVKNRVFRRWMVQNGLSEGGMGTKPEVAAISKNKGVDYANVLTVSRAEVVPQAEAAAIGVTRGINMSKIPDINGMAAAAVEPDFERDLYGLLEDVKRRILDGHNLHRLLREMLP